MYKDRNSYWRWLFLGVLIGCVLFLILAKTERVEAATTFSVNAPEINYEMLPTYEQIYDAVSMYYDISEGGVTAQNTVVFTSDGVCYYIFYGNDISKLECYGLSNGCNINAKYSVNRIFINTLTDTVSFSSFSGSYMGVYSTRNEYQGYVWGAPIYCFERNGVLPVITPVVDYPKLLGPSTTVNITVGGVDYTISEPLEYYLVLEESDGSIRLFFSDIPFTGDDVDLYTRGFYADITSTVITYYWDASEQNSFLDSRTALTGPFFQRYSYLTKTMTDYICNYNIFNSSSLLDIYLPEKTYFTSPEDILTAEDLFSVMPDELYNYNYCIVFRQQSPNAYDNRIVFYGWNETSANLYILKKNSQIAALTNKSVVSDFVTAYYDPDFATWVISDDVVLGATTDYSFNLPYIYHSDVDLFVCDEWRYWDYVGYMGDANRPIVSFEEPEEDDGLLSRLFNGLSNLFKKLFVPSTGFLNSKVEHMKSKFVFYESISDTVETIKDFFTETDFSEPPKITVDLSKSRSKYDYGDTAVCLDMSWYQEYKPSVDAFLSAVIWLVFVWNTFRNLPNIIAGIAAGGNVTTTIIKDSQPPAPQASAISRNAMKEGTTYTRGL